MMSGSLFCLEHNDRRVQIRPGCWSKTRRRSRVGAFAVRVARARRRGTARCPPLAICPSAWEPASSPGWSPNLWPGGPPGIRSNHGAGGFAVLICEGAESFQHRSQRTRRLLMESGSQYFSAIAMAHASPSIGVRMTRVVRSAGLSETTAANMRAFAGSPSAPHLRLPGSNTTEVTSDGQHTTDDHIRDNRTARKLRLRKLSTPQANLQQR